MGIKSKQATRPFFAASKKQGRAYYEEAITFEWHSGLSWQQRQRSSDEMANAIAAKYSRIGISTSQILEISTASHNHELGCALSALNLQYTDSVTGITRPVENWFQASKVFGNHEVEYGPYTELLNIEKPKKFLNGGHSGKQTGLENDPLFQRIQSEIVGRSLVKFSMSSIDYPLIPRSAFYDYIYIQALSQEQNEHLASKLTDYRIFTDIMFNPGTGKNKKYNTQARSCAIFVALSNKGTLSEALLSFDSFVKVVEYTSETPQPSQNEHETLPLFK
jgi:hypothetical protein